METNAKELMLKLAKHVRDADTIPLSRWAVLSQDILAEVKRKFPKEYETAIIHGKVNTSRKSAYTVAKAHQAKDFVPGGEYINDKRNWTPNQLDHLLNAFLSFKLPMLGGSKGRDNLVAICGRPVKAIQKALWRLGVRDPARSRFWNYTPGSIRPNRTGNEWNERDHYLLYLATSPRGIENNNWELLEHIGRILRRTPQNVFEELLRLYQIANKKPKLRKEEAFNWTTASHLNMVHGMLGAKLKKQIKEFEDDAQ